jgi:O-antigen/teichoic acid export membrane protein
MAIDLGIGIPSIDIASKPPASEHALGRIASGSALFFAGTFLGLGLNYVYAIALARLLGSEQFGLYAIGLGCFNLLSVVALAGLDTAVLRFVPALQAQSDTAGIGRIIRAALALSSGLGILFAGALLLSSDAVANRFFHNGEASNVLKVFALSIPFLVVSTVSLAALQAFREVRWRTSVKYLCEPAVKFVFTLALIWAGWGLMSALVALPIALALTTILALLPLGSLLSGKSNSLSSRTYRDVLTYSLPLLGGLVVAGIATRSDVLFLGYWVPIDQVGIYSAAFQTAAIMAVVLGTLESIATPFLSESIARNDQAQIRSLSGTVLRWTVMTTFPICVGIALFANEIMILFGDRFEGGSVCLVILAIGQFANSATGCSNGMLLWAGHSRLVLLNSLIVSAAQIALYVLLIPSFGIVGAAVAVSGGLVLSTILRVVQVHHVFHIWPYDATILKPFFSGLVALAIVLIIRVVIPSFEPVVLVGLFGVAYAASLSIFGLHEGDRAMLSQLRHRFGQSS